MEKRQKGYLVFMLISFALVFSACGGGGGGGGNGGGGGITYTGITTQAAVENVNAKDLSTGAYKGGAMGTSLSLGAVLQAGIDRPYYVDMALILEEAISQIDLHVPFGIAQTGAIVTDSGTIPGQCGGSVQYAIQADDVTGDFSGTLTFSGYCVQGVTVTGGVNGSGKYDLQNDRFLQLVSIRKL